MSVTSQEFKEWCGDPSSKYFWELVHRELNLQSDNTRAYLSSGDLHAAVMANAKTDSLLRILDLPEEITTTLKAEEGGE